MSDRSPSSVHPTEDVVQRLRDPLSEPTRSARKGLLISSVTGIAIVEANLVPTEIAALGIQLGQVDQRTLLGLLGGIILYFLVTFVLYGASDVAALFLVRDKTRVDHTQQRIADALSNEISTSSVDAPELNEALEDLQRTQLVSDSLGWWRAGFDFGLPVAVGAAALFQIATRIF